MEKLRPEQLREKANMLPLLPGVYIMLDEHGEVIYIGKAKALKNRVTSYFRGEHLPKVAAMVAHVADFNVIVVQSEFEALVLENSLIKLHKPKYNILLKDDKGYPFVRLDVTQPYPTFSLVNHTEKDGAKYFGPYGGRSMTAEIIDTVCKTLRLPTCTRRFPRDIGRARPCLNYHMGTCAGYCLKDVTRAEYLKAIREAEMILDGRTAELTAELTEQMQAAADALRFEYAASLRDRLRAIQGLQNHQRVIATAYSDTDAVGFQRGAKCCFTVLHFTDGNLTGKDRSFLDEPMEPDGEALAALVQQYYEGRGTLPASGAAAVRARGTGRARAPAHRGGGAQGRARRAAARRQVPPDGDGGKKCTGRDPHRNDEGAAQPQNARVAPARAGAGCAAGAHRGI